MPFLLFKKRPDRYIDQKSEMSIVTGCQNMGISVGPHYIIAAYRGNKNMDNFWQATTDVHP